MELVFHTRLPSVRIESAHRGLHHSTVSTKVDRFHLLAILEDCPIAALTALLRHTHIPVEDLLSKGRCKLGAVVPRDKTSSAILKEK